VASEWAWPALFFGDEEQLLRAQETLDAVKAVGERVASRHGYDLVDVEIKRRSNGALVRLFVDKTGGIGVDDLKSLSQEVSAILDVEDPVQSPYTLEVSSPGLDRPLVSARDFERNLGRLLQVHCSEPVDEREDWRGRLEAIDSDVLVLRVDHGKGRFSDVRVPLERVEQGRLELNFQR